LPYLSDKVAIALAVAALATMVANPIEQKTIPLSEEKIATLEFSYEVTESFSELEAFRAENFVNSKGFEGALYDIQTKKRFLVAEHQSSSVVFPNGATVDGKITERDIARATELVVEYRGAVLILSQNSGNWGGIGTAFRISPDLVLTNAHNIGAMDGSLPAGIRFNLTDINGAKYEAKFLGADGQADIALLRLNKPNYDLPYFSMDKWSRSYTKDEIVVSVGHPSLLGYWTPTIGTTPMGGMYSEDAKGNKSYSALANLNITSGASGSPVFDLNGNLEGILFATVANFFNAGTKDGYQVAPYLELSGIATYSLAYDFKDKVLAWAK
jgi:S1-C subfamily serine protease